MGHGTQPTDSNDHEWFAGAMLAAAALALFRYKVGVIPVIAASALTAWLLKTLMG